MAPAPKITPAIPHAESETAYSRSRDPPIRRSADPVFFTPNVNLELGLKKRP
jgi:hypothetical protein